MKNKLTMRQRVRSYIGSRDITQGQLAGECNISEARMSLILRGRSRASLAEALRIADVTGIPVEVFAGDEVTL